MKKRMLALCAAALLAVTAMTGCSPAEDEPESSARRRQRHRRPPQSRNRRRSQPRAERRARWRESADRAADADRRRRGKRPVAVMINVEAALPQYGISAADVIFEIPVEYDLTRPWRSTAITRRCRIFARCALPVLLPLLAVGFDAIYAHWGMDESIAPRR